MNGAVHGVATTVASIAGEERAGQPGPLQRAAAADPRQRASPTRQTPDRLRPKANITKASVATTSGRLQLEAPADLGAARPQRIERACQRREAREHARAYRRARAGACAPAARAHAAVRCSALIDSTGNTQGIRLRMTPASSASSAA